MEGLNEITLRDILRVIARLSDAQLIQLKSAARKEMERRSLKLNRHAVRRSFSFASLGQLLLSSDPGAPQMQRKTKRDMRHVPHCLGGSVGHYYRGPPVVSRACLQAADTLSLFASRQTRTSSLGGPCFLPAQYFGMSSLQAVATGPVCAAATVIEPARAMAAGKRALTSFIFINSLCHTF